MYCVYQEIYYFIFCYSKDVYIDGYSEIVFEFYNKFIILLIKKVSFKQMIIYFFLNKICKKDSIDNCIYYYN